MLQSISNFYVLTCCLYCHIVCVYFSHLYDLSTAETELLIVVQYCIHALNPESVHWSVKHEPFLVRSVVCHSLSDEAGNDTISPAHTHRERDRE